MPELDLIDDIRATAPQPDDDFLARLERRVEAGFADDAKPASPSPRRRLGNWLFKPQLVFAVSLVCLVAVAAVITSGGGGDGDSGSSGGDAVISNAEPTEGVSPQSKAADDAASSAGGAAASAPEAMSTAPTPPATDVAGGGDRRRLVERSTALDLTPSADDFDDTTDGVLRIADENDAIVASSNVEQREGRGYATYDLRVPSSRLDETLSSLSRLAHVRSRSSSSSDITAPYVSAQARLDDARDERTALLKALERADTDAEAAALKARIRDARARISAAEAEIRGLRARADRARLSVTVESTGKQSTGGAWTPGDAVDDAGRVLEVVAGVTVIALAVLAPLVVLALLGAATSRIVRRRRREAALG